HQKCTTCFSAVFPLKSIETKTQLFALKKLPDPFQKTHRHCPSHFLVLGC
ncbi:unnamed protein product, partial [Staurois parvus]